MLIHLLVGIAMVVVGVGTVAPRPQILSRHRRRGRSEVPAGALALMASTLTIAGAVQLVIAFQ